MPTTPKPSPIPNWLKPTLKRNITGENAPDTMDLQIVSAALAGVELDALKKRFEASAEEIQGALRRVACAVRGGSISTDAFEEYPELAVLRSGRKPAAKPGRKKSPLSMADHHETDMTLGDIEADLPVIQPGDDKSLHEFLIAAKARYASKLIPQAFRTLQSNMMSSDGLTSNQAVSKTLETFMGVGKRGPGIAIQQNFGESKGDSKHVDTPHFFEATILEAEVAEGSKGGEAHVFDERLLGQQEEGV